MNIKLCIFDLDGTLLNTIDDIGNSMNHALHENGFAPRSMEWYKNHVGFGAKVLLGGALPPDHGLSEERSLEILRFFKETYTAHCMDITRPYDGIQELLQYLAEKGIHLAVVSNKPHKGTEALMKAYFGNIEFAAIYGEQAGVPLKPDPYLAHSIMSQTGTLPEEALIIGDGEPDMIFAKNTSIFGIGVSWGFRSRETLIEAGAKVIIDKPEQVKEYLVWNT